MKLPGRFKVSPPIASAIKAVSGVADVQTLWRLVHIPIDIA
jgi:DNA polymerase III subunit alpha